MVFADFITVFGIGVGLSMDAFAVAITQGACLDIRSIRYPFLIGLTFGLFQAVMPLLGWLTGSAFIRYIARMDHWIAFILLACIGIKMFADGWLEFRKKRKTEAAGLVCPVACGGTLRFWDLMLLGFATSIDALAVGITFSMLDIAILGSIAIIGVTTYVISFAGVYIGKHAGPLLGDRMQMIGGCVLFSLGLKILLEHVLRGV
ncbi:MAG: manganese efflux pump MntP family protein [Sphaerochaetaceae bacterium]